MAKKNHQKKPKAPIPSNTKKVLASSFEEESFLIPLVKAGMGAMLARDHSLINAELRPSIVESLDLDAASAPMLPNANRWDYLLSVVSKKGIFAVEPHSAKDDQVSVLIAKKVQARLFLQDHLKATAAISRWYWVCHGTVEFSRMDRARRQLDQNGITFVGRQLRDFD